MQHLFNFLLNIFIPPSRNYYLRGKTPFFAISKNNTIVENFVQPTKQKYNSDIFLLSGNTFQYSVVKTCFFQPKLNVVHNMTSENSTVFFLKKLHVCVANICGEQSTKISISSKYFRSLFHE